MPVIRKDTEHDELKSMMGEIKTLVAEVRKEQIEAGKREVARKYLDDLVVIHEQDMQHEELLAVHPKEWVELIEDICRQK